MIWAGFACESLHEVKYCRATIKASISELGGVDFKNLSFPQPSAEQN